MVAIIAKLFRSLNARLIRTDNILVEKILKISFAVSVFVYHRQFKKSKSASGVVVIDNFDGDIKMKIDCSLSIGASLYWTGFHEFKEFIFLNKFLKPDMVFIDVGANQGEYSLFASKRLLKGNVLAFEPVPSIRQIFYDNIELNKFNNIHVFEFGLSDKRGTLRIYEFESGNEGLATLYPGDKKTANNFDVLLEPLDAVFDTNKFRRLDFIKMDIEGSELNALRGSKGVINKYRPTIMIEINEQSYKAAGYAVEDIKKFFYELDYKAYEIVKGGKLKECLIYPSFGNLILRPS